MARIRGKDTGPEKAVTSALIAIGVAHEKHARDLPGCPDIVFRKAKVAIFVDGDFWHGWRFNTWRDKLSVKWECKIEGNRDRDARNRRRLRRMGWTVIRLWEHEVELSLQECVDRVTRRLGTGSR